MSAVVRQPLPYRVRDGAHPDPSLWFGREAPLTFLAGPMRKTNAPPQGAATRERFAQTTPLDATRDDGPECLGLSPLPYSPSSRRASRTGA